ncbi:hypothetical protein OG394_39305 [Kribbella sp. NBC_01245]|uniref:hypothetical protein n=1 Tax=Kribbella sp. NBC_01245 TaxID=2903578 RepID=UPI002E29C5BC|nr:hypothetical protein [Kribbella sp. NBC_01245]
MKRFAVVIGTAVLGLTALTACGDDAPAGGTSTTQSTAGQSAEAKLATAKSDKFGDIVVDGAGKTLYVFDKDTANPSKSNCDGECEAKWPVLKAGSAAPQVEGIDASLVGTVTRTDGSKQVTLAGLPLYYFANDAKAGDVNGQAVGGIWWVVGPDGKKITAEKAPGTGETSSYSY